MDNNLKTSRIVGSLFIIATVAYSLSAVLLDPILTSSNYLTDIYANENLVIIGAFLVLIDAVAVAGISIVIYPVLKESNETLALGYVGARIGESVLFSVNVIITLTLLTLSQEFTEAGLPILCFIGLQATFYLQRLIGPIYLGLGLLLQYLL